MNTVVWLIAGCAVAWIAFSALRANVARGLVVTVVIGAMSAYFGGSVLAPLFANSSVAAGDFNALALLIACATAAAFLFVSDLVYDRYGI